MVKMFMLIAVSVALVCAYSIMAQSQIPTPSGGEQRKPIQKKSTANQQQSASDQRGTEQSPLIVKTVNPPKTEAETNQDRQERAKKASHDGWFLVFTGLLVAVALLQLGALIWQGYSLKGSLKITREAANAAIVSADAAKTSTDNLMIAERAHIFAIVEPDVEFDMWKIYIEDKELFGFSALLYLHNLGKTPAIIKEIAFWGDKLQNPPTIDNLSKPVYPLVTFIGSNEKIRENQFYFTINEAELSTIRTTEPKITFYCFGYVKYKTIFDEERCHGFCLELAPVFGKFAVCPDSELNYDI